MNIMEALLNQRKFYKTDKNYVFTIDKPSTTKAAIAGGALGAAKGLGTGYGAALFGEVSGKKLAEKAVSATGHKKTILELAGKTATGLGKFATKHTGKVMLGTAGATIPVGALIGHAMAKRKLKYADPYVQGILDKVKGQEIKRKQYRNLLKGQQAIAVSAHRLFPTAGGK